jgi:hypothetical protein
MIAGRNADKNQARLSAFACLGREKAPQSGRVIYWRAYSDNYQFTKAGCNQKRILFLTDRCRDVIENKGPLWKTRGRSRNVHENTGT